MTSQPWRTPSASPSNTTKPRQYRSVLPQDSWERRAAAARSISLQTPKIASAALVTLGMAATLAACSSTSYQPTPTPLLKSVSPATAHTLAPVAAPPLPQTAKRPTQLSVLHAVLVTNTADTANRITISVDVSCSHLVGVALHETATDITITPYGTPPPTSCTAVRIDELGYITTTSPVADRRIQIVS